MALATPVLPILRKSEFFVEMSDANLERLTALATRLDIAKGEHFMKMGAPADYLGIVESGEAELGIVKGSDWTVIDALAPGDFIGWSALLPPHEWAYDGRATRPLRFIVFDGATLRDLCDKDRAFGVEMMRCAIRGVTRRLMQTRMTLAANQT